MARLQLPVPTLEKLLLTLMVFDDEQAHSINAELPQEFFFDNKIHTIILNKIRAYISTQNKAPGEAFPELLVQETNKGDQQAKLIDQEIAILAKSWNVAHENAQMVRDDLQVYLRSRHLEELCTRVLEEASVDPDEAIELFYQQASPVASRRSALAPINMLDTAGFFARRRALQEERNQFRFPVPCLEELWIAPKRGRVMTFAGPTHGGKSHLQRETLFINLRFHHCMHVYCEHGDDPETEYRMLAYEFTKHPAVRGSHNRLILTTVSIPCLDVVDGKLNVSYTTREVDCIDNQERFIAERESVTFANLHLYRASPLSLTFADIRREIDRLRTLGVVIDMLAIDYPSKMKVDIKRETRLEEARLAMEFSQLCADYNIAGLSISQLNAEGNKAKKPTIYNLNESIDKAFIGDDIILMTADEDAKKAQVAYLICGKVKGEEHGQTAAIATCLKIGRIALNGVLVPDEEVNEIKIIQAGSQNELILNTLKANLGMTNVAVANQLGVSVDRVSLIANAFLTRDEKQQRPSVGRPRRADNN